MFFVVWGKSSPNGRRSQLSELWWNWEIHDGNLGNDLIISGFVWKCWVNIPNEIAINSHFSKRDNDQQNHWVKWGLAYFQTHPYLDVCPTYWEFCCTHFDQHFLHENSHGSWIIAQFATRLISRRSQMFPKNHGNRRIILSPRSYILHICLPQGNNAYIDVLCITV